jgi:glycosyltransferase involved in cell wall biosynthesis
MNKLVRITTIPESLSILLEGQLKYMSDYYDVTAISSGGDKLIDVKKDEGVDIFPLELTRRITPYKDFMAVIRLYNFLKKEKPFIVHTHTPKAGVVGMIASKFAGVPHRLHTIAGLPLMETEGLKRKILIFVEKMTYACATKVYPNSKGLFDFIIKEKFTTQKKLKIIGNGSSNGIDTKYFNPDLFDNNDQKKLKKDLKIEENDFVFIFVGRIVKDKGINELLSAFNKLSLQNKYSKLLLVGSYESELDPISEKSMSIIRENKAVVSVGFQKDVRPFFAISDVLTFPSYREGFPNVVMQACAMETPCIVTNINGSNEIIKDGLNGNIIPIKNEEFLFDKMKMYIENPNHVLRLKKNIRKIIQSKYERSFVCEALLKEYKKLEN